MSPEINLISVDNEATLQTAKALLITRIVAIASLFFISVSAVVIFILNLMNPTASIKNQQNQVLQNLATFKNKSASLALLNDRLKNISAISLKRKNYNPEIDKILSLASSGVSPDGLTLDNNKISFRVTSSSLLDIGQFLDSIINLSDKNQTLKNVNIDNLNANVGAGTYSLSISAELL
jgi:hypothetical protein